ncbi:hypothetical protein SAMN04488540_11295 [Ferrimonas sediminum]|uniref:Uncharacterized protein n=2 Tax=Ferrimonas sediminum TaxID=718193 RepID=A0A1G8W4F7_9GAMM|nr:hypothetical protein SAMN04488540_11295 [Ferrimonas sediminum]
MTANIIELAKEMRATYERGREEGVGLFIGSFRFPLSGSEGASRYFAYMVMTRYPECRVRLVKGYDQLRLEQHFWVVVDDRVYDLASDRFDGMSAPVMGESDTPLSARFSERRFIDGDAIFENWHPGERFQKARVLRYINHRLAQPHLHLVKG